MSPARRTAFRIVALILLLSAMACADKGVRIWLSLRRAEGWATAPGRIVQSKVASRSTTINRRSGPAVSTRNTWTMSYAFRVGDQECTGDHLTPWQPAEAVSNARAEQGRYREGREVTVHYNPSDPSESCLNVSWDGMPWFTTVLGFVLGLAGIVLVVVSFLSARRPHGNATFRPARDG